MTKGPYHNTPQRSCLTCALRIGKDVEPIHWRCGKSGTPTTNQRSILDSDCDENFSGWLPRPRRRSLRRWLLDLLWS